MVRALCCAKMGLKRGPWTHEEDKILISYINLNGHDNWRALPKQAGLLRCGKSCRLRWTNYLRPDIKRGNFSREEEDIIIELHKMLGNRWSAIAKKLPGRTDNEIKNVWHTHLKKRLFKQNQASTTTTPVTKQPHSLKMQINHDLENETKPIAYNPNPVKLESPQHSSSDDISSVTTTATTMDADDAFDNNYFPDVDENFWSDVFSDQDSGTVSGFPAADHVENANGYNSSRPDGNGMDFWYHLFTAAGGLPDLPDF